LVGCAVSGDLRGFAALLVGVVFGALALMQRRSPGAVKTAEQP